MGQAVASSIACLAQTRRTPPDLCQKKPLIRIAGKLSASTLKKYRATFPAWMDADDEWVKVPGQ
jgi:hypothetical protein